MSEGGPNRSLKNGFRPVALWAPSRKPFLSENPPAFGVISYEATYPPYFLPPGVILT